MTKEIRLTKGQVILVDDDVYDSISQWNWYVFRNGKKTYAARDERGLFKKKIVLMHRIITNAPVGMVVDHINGDGLDNRKSNLRVCTVSQNLRNRGATSRNKTGYKGVSIDADILSKKYVAQIKVNNKGMYLGRFKTAEQAARAYDEAALQHFGEFAKLNFPIK
jgi:hypothetical protein